MKASSKTSHTDKWDGIVVVRFQGWKWTYNELLVGHLWSMVTPGASEVTVIHVAYLVGILGRCFFSPDESKIWDLHVSGYVK